MSFFEGGGDLLSLNGAVGVLKETLLGSTVLHNYPPFFIGKWWSGWSEDPRGSKLPGSISGGFWG